jgi:hypothetical protein
MRGVNIAGMGVSIAGIRNNVLKIYDAMKFKRNVVPYKLKE